MLFGTFFDAYYLDNLETTPLINVTEETLENVANTSYELTFLICAILIFVFIRFIKKEKIGMKKQKDRIGAAVFETLRTIYICICIKWKRHISRRNDFCL